MVDSSVGRNAVTMLLLVGSSALLLASPVTADTEGTYYYTTCYVADTVLCTEYFCYWNGEEPERNFCRVSDQCVVRDGNRCSDLAMAQTNMA